MSLKNNWVDLIDGESEVVVKPINDMAHAIIEVEEGSIEYANNNFANALKGTASGEAIAITDASPIEREMDIKVSGISNFGAVKVNKLGKNLIDGKNPVYKLNAIYEVDSEGVATLTRGNLATGVDRTYVSRAYWKFGNYDDFVGKTFVASLDVTEKSVAKSDIVYIIADFNTQTENNIKAIHVSTTGKCTLSFTVPENTGGWKSLGMHLYCQSLGTGEATGEYIKFKDVQVEVGTTATAYEPYKEPIEYPVSADGTVEGVTPIYPTTTLMTDTAGAVIDCTYNRDINKAFAELQQAIISLGGNV